MGNYAKEYRGPHPQAIRGPRYIRQAADAAKAAAFSKSLQTYLASKATADRVRVLARKGYSAERIRETILAEAKIHAKIIGKRAEARRRASLQKGINRH